MTHLDKPEALDHTRAVAALTALHDGDHPHAMSLAMRGDDADRTRFMLALLHVADEWGLLDQMADIAALTIESNQLDN